MRLGRQAAIVFVSRFLGSALGFITTILIVNELGAEVLGYFSVVVALVSWLVLAGDLGISSAMVKRISEDRDPTSYAGAGFILLFGFIVVLSVVVFGLQPLVNEYVGKNVHLFVIALLTLALVEAGVTAILHGQRKVHIVGILFGLRLGSRSVTQIALIFVGLGFVGLLFGYGVGFLVTIVIGIYFSSLSISLPSRFHVSNIVSYAKYSWLGELENRSFQDIDIMILGAFVAPSLVGIYSATWSIAIILFFFGSAIRQVMFPEISRAEAKADDKAIADLVRNAITYCGVIMIPGLLGSVVLADRILLCCGAELQKAALLLPLLIFACLLYSYQKQMINALNGIDRPDTSFRVNLVFVILNTLLNIVLVVSLGWVGAAIATVLSAGVGLVTAYVLLDHHISFRMPWREILYQWIASFGMVAAIIGARNVLETITIFENNLLFIAALVSIGAVCYFVALIGMSENFRNTLKSNLPDPVSTF